MAIFNTLDRETITVDATVGGVALTASKYNPTLSNTSKRIVAAVIQVNTAPIRVTRDGTAPVAATTGKLRNIGDIIVIAGGKDMGNARFIRETSTSASIDVDYIGEG